MKKIYWFKFWKTSGPMGRLTEAYFYYANGIGIFCDSKIESKSELEGVVESDCEEWASQVGGGFNTHYEYGFEEVRKPPAKILREMIASKTERIKNIKKELKLLEGK